MPWNLVCDPWVSWSFYKTAIIMQWEFYNIDDYALYNLLILWAPSNKKRPNCFISNR